MQYYEVKLGGQSLRVAHERGAEYIDTVAAYVEKKLQARAQANRLPLTMRVALMTALEIADELFAGESCLHNKLPDENSYEGSSERQRSTLVGAANTKGKLAQ